MDTLKLGGAIVASVALLSTSAFAADTQAAWQGFLTVTARTSACGQIGGTSINDTVVSIYRPHITSADTPTFLSQLHTRYTVSLENKSESTVHQMRGTGNYLGHAINSRAKAFTYNGTYHFTVTPTKVVATTPYVTITGTINSFLNTAGCNVSFNGTYLKQP